MPVNKPTSYTSQKLSFQKRSLFYFRKAMTVGMITLSLVFLLLPRAVILEKKSHQSVVPSATIATEFPVTVDPATKSIVDSPRADAFFTANTPSTSASAGSFSDLISWIASLIDSTTLYRSIASVLPGASQRLVTIKPGYRKEEVVTALSQTLNWNDSQKQEFIAAAKAPTSGITDGYFSPGTYVVDPSMTAQNIAALFNVAFNRNILVHYSPTTAAKVPLAQALIVASLLQREAKGPSDMRIVSGIIWNRLFNNMNLQLDATLQYAKAESTKGNWWQKVVPKDKYLPSAFNTYAHPGLPPSPIANPSVAAVLAALNPVPTKCLFYFHDAHGSFHCSETYTQHVKLLKKYYGQGK